MRVIGKRRTGLRLDVILCSFQVVEGEDAALRIGGWISAAYVDRLHVEVWGQSLLVFAHLVSNFSKSNCDVAYVWKQPKDGLWIITKRICVQNSKLLVSFKKVKKREGEMSRWVGKSNYNIPPMFIQTLLCLRSLTCFSTWKNNQRFLAFGIWDFELVNMQSLGCSFMFTSWNKHLKVQLDAWVSYCMPNIFCFLSHVSNMMGLRVLCLPSIAQYHGQAEFAV